MSLHALSLERKAESALADGWIAARHAADVELELGLAKEGNTGEVVEIVHIKPAGRAVEEREGGGASLSW